MADGRPTIKFNAFLGRAFRVTNEQHPVVVNGSPTAAVEVWARFWLEHNQPQPGNEEGEEEAGA